MASISINGTPWLIVQVLDFLPSLPIICKMVRKRRKATKIGVLVILLGTLLGNILAQEITIYENSNYRGNSQNLTVSGCLSYSSFKNNLRNAISSIQFPEDEGCVHIYKETDCKGLYVRLHPLTTAKKDFEINGFNDQIQSIGPCHNDTCHPDYVEQSKEVGIVELFESYNYGGKLWRIELEPRTCLDTGHVWGKDVFKSILVKSPVCVEVFEDDGCPKSSNSTEFKQGVGNPSSPNLFYHRVKSLAFCGYRCPRIGNEDVDYPYVTLYNSAGFGGSSKTIRIDRGCVNSLGVWEGLAQSIKVHRHCIYLFFYKDCADGEPDQFYKLTQDEANLKNINFFRRIRSIASCNTSISRIDSSRSLKDHDWGLGGDVVIGLSVAGVLGFAVLFLVIPFGYWLWRKQNRQASCEIPLTEKDVKEILQGDNEDPSDSGYSGDYRDGLEIQLGHVNIDKKAILGHGAYGKVYRGKVDGFSDAPVAVKCISSKSGNSHIKSALKEIKTMAYVGYHPNILKLVGCCTQNIEQELLVVTELCENGSLLTLLQDHKSAYVNLVCKGQICNLRTVNVPDNLNLERPSRSYFDTFHLVDWAYQIANGMAFIASKKVIHGDLAARNVLLDGNFHVKIGDFGLSKRVYQYTEYMRGAGIPLPWKWLSPEALENMEFSTHSDVWSYGITLHEMFSLGIAPYPGMVLGQEFLTYLKDGLRPSKSGLCPTDCFNLMLECWREIPQERITFTELKERLLDVVHSTMELRVQIHRNIGTNDVVSPVGGLGRGGCGYVSVEDLQDPEERSASTRNSGGSEPGGTNYFQIY